MAKGEKWGEHKQGSGVGDGSLGNSGGFHRWLIGLYGRVAKQTWGKASSLSGHNSSVTECPFPVWLAESLHGALSRMAEGKEIFLDATAGKSIAGPSGQESRPDSVATSARSGVLCKLAWAYFELVLCTYSHEVISCKHSEESGRNAVTRNASSQEGWGL